MYIVCVLRVAGESVYVLYLAIAGTFFTTFVGEIPERSWLTTFVGDGVVIASSIAFEVVVLFVDVEVVFFGFDRGR